MNHIFLDIRFFFIRYSYWRISYLEVEFSIIFPQLIPFSRPHFVREETHSLQISFHTLGVTNTLLIQRFCSKLYECFVFKVNICSSFISAHPTIVNPYSYPHNKIVSNFLLISIALIIVRGAVSFPRSIFISKMKIYVYP